MYDIERYGTWSSYSMHGYTLFQPMGFDGLFASSPFRHPKVSAIISVFSEQRIVDSLKGNVYQLETVSLFTKSNAPTDLPAQSNYSITSALMMYDHTGDISPVMLKGLRHGQKWLHSLVDSEAYHEQMGPIPSSNECLYIALSNVHT